MREPCVCIVGVCAAGKTTLAQGLKELGVKAYSVPQEHSVVRRLWARQHPDYNVLVVLDAKYETTKSRRPHIGYGPERLDEQRSRLQAARDEADLYLPTDGLDIAGVRQAVLDFIATWKEQA